jgi:NAD(P)-dependent dehydrogenase (short-subunit alcohol dehydrogenase family)
VDVTSEESVAAMIRRPQEAWHGLDVLVNNAGVGVAATTSDTDERDWRPARAATASPPPIDERPPQVTDDLIDDHRT